MYKIYGYTASGAELFLFTWTRDPESGIERAKAEAATTVVGMLLKKFVAKPV